jgi:NAD(P)-dependent dehydrogenase (short-subunit alcohol dehydrogenase family)
MRNLAAEEKREHPIRPVRLRRERADDRSPHRDIVRAGAKSLGITPDEQFARFAKTIPVRRMGQPNEIGDLCAYLCSPQAGYLTGQTIVVDGGVNRSI